MSAQPHFRGSFFFSPFFYLSPTLVDLLGQSSSTVAAAAKSEKLVNVIAIIQGCKVPLPGASVVAARVPVPAALDSANVSSLAEITLVYFCSELDLLWLYSVPT